MKRPLNIAFFGSSLVSAYWNGAATYYRGIIKELHKKGHRVTFYEPDAYDRQKHRDLPDPEWADVVVYEAAEKAVLDMVGRAVDADILIKASGVGVFDELLESEAIQRRGREQACIFWDVDAPATLQRLEENPDDPFRDLVPQYDAVLTYGGGQPVVDAYTALGALECVPIYNAFDPETHHRVQPESRFQGDLAFLGNRLPDREARVEDFFLKPAARLPDSNFVLGGNGWTDKDLPRNVRYVNHVYTRDHNAFNVSPKAVLNISRDSMARMGFSPATRVFEAAGAGACLITDHWEGIELFLEPDTEVLVARDGEDVVNILKNLSPERARSIGEAALRRMFSEHTYAHRTEHLESILDRLVETRKVASGMTLGSNTP
ncbi:Spore maturation protein CgeB [Desulfonatronum thiosulfatophilum]|uniref:Spore maturation protein CgeB n=1 Tax=Desulfonatronum thiosulfatophilum TaxID=617002 RepID=A0A1G6BCS1_9BACT|nr:glycosyltransferase [Desulfonatronum thiosulfatophilum]SDB18329.1 Spore maturation protein CgeB [Desulfonatronum thiosulfatophilum]